MGTHSYNGSHRITFTTPEPGLGTALSDISTTYASQLPSPFGPQAWRGAAQCVADDRAGDHSLIMGQGYHYQAPRTFSRLSEQNRMPSDSSVTKPGHGTAG
jgi:hypothetical protein